MTKHSPGRWEINDLEEDSGQIVVWEYAEDATPTGLAVIVPFVHLGHEEAVANAQLMVSAPALLAAAERYLEFRHKVDCGFGYEFSGVHPETELKAAIARAKGEAE